jgi:hypothetical protein
VNGGKLSAGDPPTATRINSASLNSSTRVTRSSNFGSLKRRRVAAITLANSATSFSPAATAFATASTISAASGGLAATRTLLIDLSAQGNAVQAEPKRRRIARKRHLDALCPAASVRSFKLAYDLHEKSEFARVRHVSALAVRSRHSGAPPPRSARWETDLGPPAAVVPFARATRGSDPIQLAS